MCYIKLLLKGTVMKVGEINPYIRQAKESTLLKGMNINQRIIFDYELLYLREGNFTLIYNGDTFYCKKGDVILIEPGVQHEFIVNTTDISQPHIHFDLSYRANSEKIPICFKDITAMTDKEKDMIHENMLPSYPTAPLLVCKNKTRFLTYFNKIVSKRPTSPLVRKGLLLELLGLIFYDNFWGLLRKEQFPTIAHQVKDYIDRGNGLDMSLDDLSKFFSYSKFHLEKKFKECFNVSIITYKNQLRMQKAKELLMTNSVSKTAKILGYNSIHSFSRTYKNYYQQSPTSSIKEGKKEK
ncbi:MAG: AraC family transcriptional regulator [Clostridiales bacterium]|nr:AraC family transcriptional regulator [Clostridiales bacterium]